MTVSRFITSQLLLLLLAISYSYIDIHVRQMVTQYIKYREYIIIWAVDPTVQSTDSTKIQFAPFTIYLH